MSKNHLIRTYLRNGRLRVNNEFGQKTSQNIFLQKKREEDQAAREAQFYKDQAQFYGQEYQGHNTNEPQKYPTEAPAQGYSTFGYSTLEYNQW